MTDTELTANDARRLHLMEEMLRDRGRFEGYGPQLGYPRKLVF